jgi:hypothetical protein
MSNSVQESVESPVSDPPEEPEIARRSLPTWSREEKLTIAIAVGIAIFGVALAAYARYLLATRPGVTTPKGFYGFFDQSQYLAMARIFSRGRIPSKPSQYLYGPGYPILGAPFIRLGFRGDPFAPVDTISFGVTLALTFLLGTRAMGDRSRGWCVAVGIASAGVVALSSPMLSVSSLPFNTNIVTPLGLVVLLIALSDRAVTVPRALTLGISVGWIFATRYADALFLGLPVIALFFVRAGAERKRIAIWGGLGLAAILAPTLASQQYALGSWMNTPYQFHMRNTTGGSDQSINQYRLSWIPTHLIGTFLTGRLHGKRVSRDPLLRQYPLLALAPLGAWFECARKSRTRFVWITSIGGSILGSLFYLAFIAGGAGDLAFGNQRYWDPWYPLWAVLAVVALARILERAFEAAGTKI